MPFSDSVLQEYSISKGLVTEDGNLNLYLDGEFKEVSSDSELRESLAGTGVRVAIAENLVGTYDPTGTSVSSTSVDSNEDFFDKLEGIFENFGKSSAVDTPEDVLTPGQIEDIVPWLKGKGSLLQTYTNSYIETGSADFSIAAVRQSEEYPLFYPGIRRDDGSLRMTETQYEQTREGYFRVFLENGLNPTVFDQAGKVAQLIAGDVSVKEFRTRVERTRQAFIDNPLAEEIKSYYSANFGVDVNDEAVLVAGLDPDMSVAILTNQISQAELGAEAALRNLELNTQQAQRLLQAGITQEGASRLFARSADKIATLNRLSRQQSRTTPITLESVIQTDVFQDPAAARQQQAILAQQASLSSLQTGARKTQGGAVAGLEEA